jgi:hypothetical protein
LGLFIAKFLYFCHKYFAKRNREFWKNIWEKRKENFLPILGPGNSGRVPVVCTWSYVSKEKVLNPLYSNVHVCSCMGNYWYHYLFRSLKRGVPVKTVVPTLAATYLNCKVGTICHCITSAKAETLCKNSIYLGSLWAYITNRESSLNRYFWRFMEQDVGSRRGLRWGVFSEGKGEILSYWCKFSQ